MSSGVREEVNQSVRTWIKAAAGGLSDADVCMAYDDRPKRGKPFINVVPQQHFAMLGEPDVKKRRTGGRIEIKVRTSRYSTYRLQAFGPGALPWLEDLSQTLYQPDVRKVLGDEYISPTPTGPINDISETVAGTWERRTNQDWRIDYLAETDWVDVGAEFSELDLSGHLRDSPDQTDADALDLDYTLTD